MWSILADSRWAKLKYVLILTILMANVKDIQAGLPPLGACEIPVDPYCRGCDFEEPDSVTTEFWGASVEAFLEIGSNNKINIVATPTCSTSVDINHQCRCSGPQISTPVYYCNNHIDKFMDFDFYTNCSSEIDPLSPFLNHFRIASFDSIYSALGIDSNPCSQFAGHFGANVLKLGDDYQGRKMATLTKRIIVSPDFLDFNFDYALILQNPAGHSHMQKPSFRVLIYKNDSTNVTFDENGKTRVDLNWGSNEIFANHPKLKIPSNPALRYLGWSCGKIDLSDFNIGDTLYVVFEQRDCGRGGGHWSKVYLDNIGNGMCSKIAEGEVSYNTGLSYTCNDTTLLAFNYDLPVINLDTLSVVGDLEIVLKLSGIDSISSGTISNNNGQSGTYIFKIPNNLLSDYVKTTFTYTTATNVGCYNLVPYRHEQQIHLPTANICNPECSMLTDSLPAGYNINNTYLLDDNFKVVTADNPTSGVIHIVREGENPQYFTSRSEDNFPNNTINGCIVNKTLSGFAIADSTRKHNLEFLLNEPVETFYLKLLDYGPAKSVAISHGVYLKSYDSLGTLLSVDSLRTIVGQDFCDATPSSKYTTTKHTGDYTLYASGYKIKKVELSFFYQTSSGIVDYSVDPNVAISDMCYVPCSKPKIAIADLLCPGDTIHMGIVNFRTDKSYSWTGPREFKANTPYAMIPNAGSYHNGNYILSSYSPNCGTMFDTVSISLGDVRTRFLGNDTVLCAGQIKVLDATTPGATYLWKGGATTPTITVDTTGIFWVAVTTNGCTEYDTIKVTFIEDPALQSIPYKTRHNCIKDDSGILQLLWNQKTGGILTVGDDPTAVTYIDDLSYYLYKDNLENGTYDALCSEPYGPPGLLSAGFRDSLFITGLDTGDYKIVLKPNTICRKVIEDSITTDSICIPYSQCYNDSITFTFTIRKHIYPRPLEDKILCPGGMVSLRVPSHYYDNLPPESITWKSVCGIYETGYNFSQMPADVTISTDTLRNSLINGRGGVHTVEIVTQDGCIIRDTAVVADLKPLIIPDSMPSALATNAVNYSSFWSTQYNNVKWQDADMVEIFRSANIYFKGEAGIYRPKKNHDYLDSLNTTIGFTSSYSNASPSTQLNDINIRSTGNIMPYKLFNYGNPLFVDCVPQWIHNSTMTKYSPSGFDIENKDIMGIHSSALYGYNDMLPIAVASNAKNDEIGYESFEEYSKDSQALNCYDSLTQLNNSTGNIDLVRQTESLLMPKSKDYEVVRAFNRYAMIKGNICNACEDPFKVEVNAQTVPTDIRVADIKEKNFTSYKTRIFASPCSDSNYTILQLDKGSVSQTFEALKCGFWVGNIKVTEDIFVPLIENTGFELDDTKAHTGNYSLKIPKNQQVFLPQTDMTLQPRQTYHIGAWVHSASMDTLSPGGLKQRHITDSIGIFVKLPNNETVFIRPSGEVINSWQKIEGTFTMPAGTRTQIQLGFHAAEEFNIDDIRIYPQNSAIQTYVYDPNNYKVRAVLDQNNYATVYQYDDEGNLFAIKKETVKGIKTIQVSGSHLKSEK